MRPIMKVLLWATLVVALFCAFLFVFTQALVESVTDVVSPVPVTSCADCG